MPTYGSSGWKNPPSEDIKNLLQSYKTIAVVGLSSKPNRPSNSVAEYLQSKGYKIIPVNPKETEILGEKCYPDLTAIPVRVDIVDIFRKPAKALKIVDQAIMIGAKAVWMQEGIISLDAFKRGEEAGLLTVMDRCMLKEHRRLIL